MDPGFIIFSLFFILILLVITCFGVLVYSGLFSIPTVQTSQPPIDYECIFAYQYIRGSAYSGNEVGATFTLATSIAPKAPSVGIFYDDPETVPEHELRCAVGCLISREDVIRATADTDDVVDAEPENVITRRLVSENEEEMLKKKNFRFCRLPQVDMAVTSEFPYTTPFSIWLAPNKVYPHLREYISYKNLCAYPIIELYANNRINYMAPLSKQDGFFVPEAKLDVNDRQLADEDTPKSQASKKTDTDDTAITEDIHVESISFESPPSQSGDDSSTIRRRNVPQCDHIVTIRKTDESSSMDPASNGKHLEIDDDQKRKMSSDSTSSSASSFEKLGVDELK